MFFANYSVQNENLKLQKSKTSANRRSSSKCNVFGKDFFAYDIFTYSTARSATIKSYKVGLIYRLVQLLLLAYIFGYELFYNKRYQSLETVSSVITTKVKGQGFIPIEKNKEVLQREDDWEQLEALLSLKPNLTYRILDTADYVIPPVEYNSIFIMSNYIETLQTQGLCDEELNKAKSECSMDQDCKKLGTFVNTWNGIPTGRCIPSSIHNNRSVCEIRAWCPTEHDSLRKYESLIRNVLNYTIFIKNDIEFKKFSKRERNIAPNITNKYISQCTYEGLRDPFCPVFQVGYILKQAEPDNLEKFKMLIKGGVILIEVVWNCDYDWSDTCQPKYYFRRFDTKESNTASGFNFRYANKFMDSDRTFRVLYKAYGLRFIINVSGSAGKFNIVPFMLTIGAGLGLMSLSVLFADCVLLHCTKKKSLYKRIKEMELKGEILGSAEVDEGQ